VGHLNTKQIDGLISAAGIDNTKEILEAFWRSTENLINQLQSQIAIGDTTSARQSAHAIKGSAANVGALVLQNVAAEIENSCHDGDDDLLSSLDLLYVNFDETRREFEKHLTKYQ